MWNDMENIEERNIRVIPFSFLNNFSSIISISFHYSTYHSSIFSISFHYFLPYFPYLFTIFFCIFQIFSLFDLLIFHIFQIISLFNLSFYYSSSTKYPIVVCHSIYGFWLFLWYLLVIMLFVIRKSAGNL
jgi:hypothetical protein